MKELGGRCAQCGTEEELEFDVIVPQNGHQKWNTVRRMIFYRRQNEKKNLQILCRRCNAKKGNKHPELALETNPF